MRAVGVLVASLAFATMQWIVPASAQEYRGRADDRGDTLPADFRGRITYQGNFSAKAFRAGRAPANASNIVRRIARGNDREWSEDGTITITVEFDGNRIRGSHSGSGGMGRGTFTGTRNGRFCTISSGQGDQNTVECTRTTWSGTSRSAAGARIESTVQIDARATQFVDAGAPPVQAPQRGAAPRPEARTTPVAGVSPARQGSVAPPVQPAAPTGTAGIIDRAIRQDSQSWLSNTYDPGSVSDVRRTGGSGGTITYSATYTFNQGIRGSVVVDISGNRVRCLQFFDTNSCVPPRASPNSNIGTTSAVAKSEQGALATGDAVSPCLSETSRFIEGGVTRGQVVDRMGLVEREASIKADDRSEFTYFNKCNHPIRVKMTCPPPGVSFGLTPSEKLYTLGVRQKVVSPMGPCFYISEI